MILNAFTLSYLDLKKLRRVGPTKDPDFRGDDAKLWKKQKKKLHMKIHW